MTRATTQTIPDNIATWTPITWTAEEADVGANWPGSGASVTLSAGGIWLFNLVCVFQQPAGAGRLGARIGFGGGGYGTTKVATGGASGGTMYISTTWMNNLGAAGVITGEVNQNGQGGSYTLTEARFSGALLGPAY